MYGIIEYGSRGGYLATLRAEPRQVVTSGTGGPSIVTVGGFVRAVRRTSKRACRVYLARNGAESIVDEAR